MSYLNIKGKGLRFDQGTWTCYLQKVDFANFIASSTYAGVYAAMWSNSYRNDEPLGRLKSDEVKQPAMTFAEVCDFVDLLTTEEKKQIKDAFEGMNEYKTFVEELESTKEQSPEVQKKTLKNTALTV